MISRRDLLRLLWVNGKRTAALGALACAGSLAIRDPDALYPLQNSPFPAGVGKTRSAADIHRTRLLERTNIPGLLRPPGAVPEKEFLSGCIRCYRCQDACVPGAIQFFTEQSGRNYHTPFVEPAIKACNLCMKCTHVCPTGVLLPQGPEDRAKVKMGTVEFREDLCLSFKAKRIRDEQARMYEFGSDPAETDAPVERRGPCGECYMFCPLRESAIKLEPGAFLSPVVYPENCAGCGMCEEICRFMVRGEPAIRAIPTRPREGGSLA